ncbi:MAG: hypothetical protein O7G30_02325, partial [Proteobacteria bacterium]|nr:hypothetical protein [Pseudomonadota bacterium]
MARTLAPLLALGMTAALLAPPAAAFEAFDGRLQAHGYYEMQVRTISSNFSEDWDITQWYNVFNLELELDILQDTWGLLDLVSAYVRLEVRYDCVYSHGCGMFRSINAFGDDSKSLPRRLSNAHQLTANGAIPLDFTDEPLYRLDNDTGANVVRKLQAGPGEPNITTRRGQRRSVVPPDPVGLELVSGFVTLAGGAGPDGFQGNPSTSEQCALKFRGQTTGDGLSSLCDALAGGSASGLPFTDDPFGDVFASWKDFRFTQIDGKGGASAGLPTSVMGPWLPKNFVHPNAGLADRINPFDSANAGTSASQSLQAAIYNQILIT